MWLSLQRQPWKIGGGYMVYPALESSELSASKDIWIGY